MFALGGFLWRAGLEDADRWASVIGVLLNIVGLVATVYSLIQARRTPPAATGRRVGNSVRGGEFSGPAVLARDLSQISMTGAPVPSAGPALAAGDPLAGDVENTIDGGNFHGPVIMGRDMRGVVLPPPNGRPGSGGGR